MLAPQLIGGSPVHAAGCYVRSAPLFTKAKNFADNDVTSLTESGATLKGAIGNAYGTGTRSWDIPGARLCTGDHISLTISAGGPLALLGRIWSTSGNQTVHDLEIGLGDGFPERSFLSLPPGGDLGGISGSRTYKLAITDFPFSIGVWVRDTQGDNGVLVWNYVADTSAAPAPRPQAPLEPTPMPTTFPTPLPELSTEAPPPSAGADLQISLSGCPGALDVFTALQAAQSNGLLITDPAQSGLAAAWPRRDVLLGMLEKLASVEDSVFTSMASSLFGPSPTDVGAGTGYVNYLGSLLTEQAPPRHTRNTYVQLTRDRRPLIDGTQQASYESALADRIAASPGGLMPADVLQMAIDVTGGDYPLAMLTTHNLLKELKYSSTAQGGTGVALVGWFPDSRGTDADALGGGLSGYDTRRTDPLIAKLVNLRPASDPLYASDPVGPWYHQFGVLFVGSVTSGDEATLSAWVENATRWLGLGSRPDAFKETTNTCAGRLAQAISTLVPAPSPDQQAAHLFAVE